MEIGVVLSSQYGLVKCILEHLSAFELIQTSKHVCKLWNDVTEVILRGRRRMEFFYYEGSKTLPQKKILEKVKEEFSRDFQEFLRHDVYSVPTLGFIISSGDERQFHYSSIQNRDNYPYDDYKRLYDIFPKMRSLCVSSFDGIVTPSKEIETRRFVLPSFTFLSFPSFQNVKIHTFDLTSKSSSNVMIKDLIPDLEEDEVIKGVIAFSSDDVLNPTLGRLILNCMERSNKNIALAGALVSLTWCCSSTDQRPDVEMAKSNVSGFVFTGDGVQVKSIILACEVNNVREVERELSKLEPDKYPQDVTSYAFMFACCGRGKAHYRQESNIESSTFRRLFPHTKLVGCFCGGEIGINSFSNSTKVKNMNPDNLFHSYTTVFMLISLHNKNIC
ncbi:F-box only protein 22 [Lepeophtheirus salmonis]|uniref:F-box only protein 22 n=1 Tax=Lepeophtheirus salmonis TaxID=72036 RepID=UPI001AE951CA|nr:F-box only protein 22-like [Lepeophtheirus salmonis]